jgi:3-oxoacyl-[acyl-carrier protein] reductase
MYESLAGRSVLITGGSAGIGFGIARLFARASAKVTIVARTSARVTAAVNTLALEGPSVQGLVGDISRREDVESVIAAVASAQGGLDVLCLNAGIYPLEPFDTLSEESWDHVLAVNLRSNFLCVQKALGLLRRSEQPRVVLISSITGPVTGIAGLAHYGASKAAQLGFMRNIAVELAASRITVNAVLPGTILTDSLSGLGAELVEAATKAIPLGRLGTVDDIGHAVLFLASREAGFITGQTLIVDGGQVLPESA